MVPGSTFKYGSSLRSLTLKPRACSNAPSAAVVRPLPREETTPPVIKMNRVMESQSTASAVRLLRKCRAQQDSVPVGASLMPHLHISPESLAQRASGGLGCDGSAGGVCGGGATGAAGTAGAAGAPCSIIDCGACWRL